MAAINRRDFFKGLGAGVVLLNPMLRMLANAQTAGNAKYFIYMFSANGTVLPKWYPSGTSTAGSLNLSGSQILSPLQHYAHKITCLQGVHNKTAGPGDDHVRGTLSALTAAENNTGTVYTVNSATGYNSGKSIDQEIATRFGYRESLVAGCDSYGFFSLVSSQGSNQPVQPNSNPRVLHSQLFSQFSPPLTDQEAQNKRKKSVLDFAIQDMNRLKTRIPSGLYSKLDEHSTEIRDLEKSISVAPSGTPLPPGCSVPTLGPASDYDEPREYLNQIHMQMENVVLALKCGLYNSAVIVCGAGVDNRTHTWLNQTKGHHGYSHETESSSLASLTAINNWYAQRFRYLLDLLDISGMLDQSVVLWGNELSDGARHNKDNIPYVIAGGGGGKLKGGRYLNLSSQNNNQGRPHGELLVSIANAFGVNVTSYGHGNSRGARSLPGLLT